MVTPMKAWLGKERVLVVAPSPTALLRRLANLNIHERLHHFHLPADPGRHCAFAR
jgi:hypothetical protein